MAVFLDVLPRLGLSEAEIAFNKLKEMAAKTGKEMGLSLGEGATSGLDKLKEAAISTERVVSDAFTKQAIAAQKYEAQVLKVAEVEKARGTESAAYAAAMTKQLELQAKATQATRDYSEAAVVANGSSAAFVASQEAKSRSVLNTTSVLNGVGIASFLAFGAAVGVSADKAANFEQSQTKLVASAGESAGALKQVSDGILQMAGTVGYSAGQLSDAMYVVEKGGFNAAKGGLDVLKAAAQGANAEQADLAEVTKGLTISMNDFKFPTQNAADVMSKLVVATGASTATFQEFTGALHSVEPAAAAAGIKYEDLLATISQGTKSGASADQVTENIRNALNALTGASGPARTAMAQLGISADDVSQHLRDRGLAGSFQYLADTIKAKMDPNNLIPTGTFKQNAQELDNMTASLNAMSPAARALAEGLRNGTVDAMAFRKGLMGTSGDDTQRLRDFQKMSNDLDDFSKRFKNGQSTLETYNQALRDVTGTVAGQSIALQVTGDNAQTTNDLIAKLTNTTREHDGTVKGFNESQETLNAKMRDAKAAFGAAAIELGDLFIPALKGAADLIKETAEFLAQHKEAVQDATIVVGLLGGAWVVTKAAMAIGSLVSTLAGGMAAIGGFVMGLAGKYDALAVSAEAAAVAERNAANPTNFAKGAATGAGLRGAATAVGAITLPAAIGLGALLGEGQAEKDQAFSEGKTALAPIGPHGMMVPVKVGPFGTNPSNATSQGSGGSLPISAIEGVHGDWTSVTPAPGDNNGALPVAQGTVDPSLDPGIPGGGAGGGGDGGAGSKKPPKGDKDDPIWIKPGDPADFKGDSDHGTTGSSIIKGGFDFSPKSIGTFFSALLIDLAVGNPIGKTLATEKLGSSPSNPMYITSVDVDKAKARLDKAIRDNGPDSEEAKHAAAQLQGTQAAVGTTGGYFDPGTGGITARDPSGGEKGGLSASQKSVAEAIIQEGQKRGLSRDQIVAGLNTAKLESNYGANPASRGQQNQSGTIVQGIFQQDLGYSGDHNDPSNAAGQFFDRMIQRGKPGQSAGQQAVNVPVGQYGSGYVDSQGQGGVYDSLAGGATPPAGPTSLIGGGGAGPTGIYDPSQIIVAPGGSGPGLTGPGGGGGLNIGGGAGGRGNAWPNLYGASTSIGGGATRGPSASKPVPGMNVALAGAGGSGGAGASNTAPAPRSWGSGKGASSSVGSSIASAAGSALDLIAPGASELTQKGGQLIDRTIGYAAQVGGIAVEGLLQSLIPTGGGGGIGDPSHSLIGRIAGGVAGAHKTAPNTAGTTAPPLPKDDDKDKSKGGDTNQHIGAQQNGGINTGGGDVHISAPSPQSFASDQPQNQYPYATR